MAMYAVAVRGALHEVQTALWQACECADVVAYADDTYFVVSVQVIAMALQCFAEVMGAFARPSEHDKNMGPDLVAEWHAARTARLFLRVPQGHGDAGALQGRLGAPG